MRPDCPHCESDNTEMLGGWSAWRCLECGHEWLYEESDENYNETLRGAIRPIRDMGISRGMCLKLLMEYYAPRCQPPVTPAAAAAAVRYVYDIEPLQKVRRKVS